MVKNDPVSCIDGAINGGINDKELDILSILDFPLESLGGDELAEDWDVSKFQCLEPIPSDLLGSSVLPQNQIRPPFLSHLPIVPLDKILTPKSQAKQSAEASNPLHRHTRADPSQSPVSVLFLCNASQIRRAARSKRAKPSRNSCSSTLPVVIPSPSTTSKKTPGRAIKNTSSSSSKRLKNSNQPSSIDIGSSLNPNDFVKVCSHCQSTETPQWREGPMGPQTLCNACGVRYRTGRLFPEYRPANSPTFVPSVHSNCHKKVMEMRSRARGIHH